MSRQELIPNRAHPRIKVGLNASAGTGDQMDEVASTSFNVLNVTALLFAIKKLTATSFLLHTELVSSGYPAVMVRVS